MKKILFIIAFGISLCSIHAQKKVEETISIKNATKLYIKAEYASITVKTWGQNNVSITGNVNIYDNSQNEMFNLEHSMEGTLLKIESYLDGLKQKQRVWVSTKD